MFRASRKIEFMQLWHLHVLNIYIKTDFRQCLSYNLVTKVRHSLKVVNVTKVQKLVLYVPTMF